MQENHMVQPFADDDARDIRLPTPCQIYAALPNKLADELVADEIFESAGNGKTHLQNIFDSVTGQHGHGVSRIGVVEKAVYAVIDAVGRTKTAEEWWVSNVWCDGEWS